VDAIFYVVKNGCTWRSLPHDLPPWKTVYHYFRLWRMDGTWQRLNRFLRRRLRRKVQKHPQASVLILDSQTAKSLEGGWERGYDGGKHVNGRKRQVVVDTLGWLMTVKVTAGNVQDVFGGTQVLLALSQHPGELLRLVKIYADGSYRGDLVDWVRDHLHVSLEIVLKDDHQKGFQVLPKRWIVERTFAWLSRQRRLSRDYERLAATSEAWIYVAMIRLMLNRDTWLA
jgi:putative transposase